MPCRRPAKDHLLVNEEVHQEACYCSPFTFLKPVSLVCTAVGVLLYV